MMCLEDTWFVAAFHFTPMHDPGLKEVQRPARVYVCKGASGSAASHSHALSFPVGIRGAANASHDNQFTEQLGDMDPKTKIRLWQHRGPVREHALN